MLTQAVVALTRRFELPDPAVPAQQGAEQRFRGLRVGNLGLLVVHA